MPFSGVSREPRMSVTIHPSMPTVRPGRSRYVLVGGLVAGTLDMAHACLFWAFKADVPATWKPGGDAPRETSGGAPT
jgi:hypothetical protein